MFFYFWKHVINTIKFWLLKDKAKFQYIGYKTKIKSANYRPRAISKEGKKMKENGCFSLIIKILVHFYLISNIYWYLYLSVILYQRYRDIIYQSILHWNVCSSLSWKTKKFIQNLQGFSIGLKVNLEVFSTSPWLCRICFLDSLFVSLFFNVDHF